MSCGKVAACGEWILKMTFMTMLVRSVSSVPVINRNPPLILTSNPLSVEISEFETVKLECPVFSQPQAFISWQKDGSSINQGWVNYRVVGNNLRIKNATRQDQGCFTCLAVNGFGSVEVKMQLKVSSSSRKVKELGSDTNMTSDRDPFVINETTAEQHEETSTSIEHHSNASFAPTFQNDNWNSSMRSYNFQPEEIYILIATGVVFFAIAVCLIVLVVLLHLTYGLPCRANESEDSNLSSRRAKHPQYSRSNYGHENVSSSVSQLLVSSYSSIGKNHEIRDPLAWSLLGSTTLADEEHRSGSLKF